MKVKIKKNKYNLKVLEVPFFIELMCRRPETRSKEWKISDALPRFKRNGFYRDKHNISWCEYFYDGKWFVFFTTDSQFNSMMDRIIIQDRMCSSEEIKQLRQISEKHKEIKHLLNPFLQREKIKDNIRNIEIEFGKLKIKRNSRI